MLLVYIVFISFQFDGVETSVASEAHVAAVELDGAVRGLSPARSNGSSPVSEHEVFEPDNLLVQQVAAPPVTGPAWPNENWRRASKLINSCHMSDGDADMLLDTLRSVDVRLSIPQNVRELRRFERSFIGGGM
jgi:hypothetical protein